MPILRKLFYALIIVLTLVVGATSAVVIVTQTAWFKDWLRGYIVRQANQYVNGQVSIERLGGNLFFGVELEKVGISLDGEDLVAVKDLGLKYNVFQLISTGLSIDEIRLNHPVIYLRRDGDTWSLAKLVKPQAQEADREGPVVADERRCHRHHRWRRWSSTERSRRPRSTCPNGSSISTPSCRSSTSRSDIPSRLPACRSVRPSPRCS